MINELKTDYKDDILATGQQGRRTFNIIDKNGNVLYEGVHIEDASEYLQVGDEYGGDIINEQNESINSMDDKLDELIEFMDNGIKAEDVSYNNSTVKATLDSLSSNKQNKIDNTLTTTSKTVTGAINELNNDLTNMRFSIESHTSIGNNNNIRTITPNHTPKSKFLGMITGGTASSSIAIDQIFTQNGEARCYFSANVPNTVSIEVTLMYLY